MSEIKESMTELIGKIPLLRLNRYMEKSGIKDAVILPDSGDRYLSTALFEEA